MKGTKLLASLVWQDALANQMSREQVAENWDVSLAAIDEIWKYCETNRSLIELEAREEHYRLAGMSYQS